MTIGANRHKTLQEIEEHVSTPEVAFTGDTTIDFLDGELSQEVLNAKLLIMETTILDDLLAPDEVKVLSSLGGNVCHVGIIA